MDQGQGPGAEAVVEDRAVAGGETAAIGESGIRYGRILWGAFFAALLAACGVWAVTTLAGGAEGSLTSALARARTGPVLGAALFGVVTVVLGGTRLWVLARGLGDDLRWRDGLRAQLYNVFAGGLTPAGTGGGPAQYWVLTRSGLDGPRTVLLLTATWVGNMMGLVVLAGLSFAYLSTRPGSFLSGVPASLGGLFLVVATVAAVLLFVPGPLARLADRAARRWESDGLIRVRDRLREYRESVGLLFREGRGAWLLNAMASWAMVISKCVAGVLVLRALGVTERALSAAARQALQFALIYVTPTPGGSGVAEMSALGVMRDMVPPELLGGYTVLWRATTAWILIAVGAVWIAVEFGRRRIGAAPGDGTG